MSVVFILIFLSVEYYNFNSSYRTDRRNLFNNLKSLSILNMEQNQLEKIEDRSFNSLVNLRIARFSKNKLTLASSFEDEYGKKSYFYDCTSLEELHLAHNNISEIFADWTINGLQLRLLNLSYNQIPYILVSCYKNILLHR